jgi:Transposase DDE domain group 1
MVELTPFLPSLSPVQGKAMVARFDGGFPVHRHRSRTRPRQAPLPAALTARAARSSREPHQGIEENHLAADRTSCHAAEANQFRLFLHAGAYWLLWSMRRGMPKHSVWWVMQFDTLRQRLISSSATNTRVLRYTPRQSTLLMHWSS